MSSIVPSARQAFTSRLIGLHSHLVPLRALTTTVTFRKAGGDCRAGQQQIPLRTFNTLVNDSTATDSGHNPFEPHKDQSASTATVKQELVDSDNYLSHRDEDFNFGELSDRGLQEMNASGTNEKAVDVDIDLSSPNNLDMFANRRKTPSQLEIRKAIDRRRNDRLRREKTIRIIVWKKVLDRRISSSDGSQRTSINSFLDSLVEDLKVNHGITCRKKVLHRIVLHIEDLQKNFFWKDMDTVIRNAIEERRRFWIHRLMDDLKISAKETPNLVPPSSDTSENSTATQVQSQQSHYKYFSSKELLHEHSNFSLDNESLLQLRSKNLDSGGCVNASRNDEQFYNARRDEFIGILTGELRSRYEIPARRIDVAKILRFYQEFKVGEHEDLIEVLIRCHFVRLRKWSLVLPAVRNDLLTRYLFNRIHLYEQEQDFDNLLTRVKSSMKKVCSFVDARRILLSLPEENRDIETLKKRLLQEYTHIPYDSRLESLIAFVQYDEILLEMLEKSSSTTLFEQLGKTREIKVSKHYIALLEREKKRNSAQGL